MSENPGAKIFCLPPEVQRRWDDDNARWAAIDAPAAAGKSRYEFRQRVGMPRGVQPVRRRDGSVTWWAVIVFALLAVWGLFLAVTL